MTGVMQTRTSYSTTLNSTHTLLFFVQLRKFNQPSDLLFESGMSGKSVGFIHKRTSVLKIKCSCCLESFG